MHNAPGFFIVGAPKSGTTSLYRYLGAHPGIFMSPFKEPNYYCRQSAARAQTQHYDSQQKYLSLFADARPDQLCGEASTFYLRAPEAPGLIQADVPGAKIIMLLREPGERALSHYQMRFRAGDFGISFSQGLALREGEGHARDYEGFRDFVIGPGFYGAQVPRYIELFGRDNVLVLVAEEFFADPETHTAGVLRFLGVDDTAQVVAPGRFNDYREPRGRLGLALARSKTHLRFLKPLVPVRLKWWVTSNLLNRPGEKPSLSASERDTLTDIYRDDVIALRNTLERPHLWRDIYA